MKRLIITLIIATTLFGACKKYDDGPAISFRTFHSRLYHLWTVEKYIIDGADSTQLFNDSCGCSYFFNHQLSDEIRLVARGGKNVQYDISALVDIIKHKTIKLRFDFNNNNCKNIGPLCLDAISYILTITRLTKDELWLESTLNNKNFLIKLKHN